MEEEGVEGGPRVYQSGTQVGNGWKYYITYAMKHEYKEMLFGKQMIIQGALRDIKFHYKDSEWVFFLII